MVLYFVDRQEVPTYAIYGICTHRNSFDLTTSHSIRRYVIHAISVSERIYSHRPGIYPHTKLSRTCDEFLAMEKVFFLVVCMLLVGNSLCRNVIQVSATKRLTHKKMSVADDSSPESDIVCSEKRLQQIQEWMPEHCPSLKDVLYSGALRVRLCDSECGKTCGQYLYEGMKECYGDFAAFIFEQTYVVDETGADCSRPDNKKNIYDALRLVPDDCCCNVATINTTFCAPKCSNVLQHLSELYGCCLPTLALLGIPTPYNYELIQLQNNLCNVSTGFCAPVFSQTIIGLPPETNDTTTFASSTRIALAVGLSSMAFIILLIISSLVLLSLIVRVRKKKNGG